MAKKKSSEIVVPHADVLPGSSIKSLTLKHDRPEVAELIARTLVSYVMDYEATTSDLLRKLAKTEGCAEPTPAEVSTQARILERSTSVQRAVLKQVEKIGLGDEAQAKVTALLWKAAYDKHNDRRWPSAMALLVKLTGMDKGKKSAPEKLLIDGLNEGVKQMMAGAEFDPEADTPEPDVNEEDL